MLLIMEINSFLNEQTGRNDSAVKQLSVIVLFVYARTIKSWITNWILIRLKSSRHCNMKFQNWIWSFSGEFQLRLRQLEKSLLQALNEVKGRILDDDTIITTLENLKKEAAEVTRKVEETDIVMQEVETVSQQYLSLSSACSSIYFTMESLNQVWLQISAWQFVYCRS